MSETLDIPLLKMMFMYALLIVPIFILAKLKFNVTREVVWAVLRMTVQLTLVGLYLKYIFELNSLLITSLWIAVMLVMTNVVVINRAGLNIKLFLASNMVSITFSTIATVLFFVIFVISPDPLFDARYMIPVTGMILGNTLRANVITLERFYSSVHDKKEQHLTYLMMGATLEEAIMPHFKTAVRAAISPTIASMATIGVVSLPGMMTGQILGGTFPLVAIKYQIAIMICIFSVMTISAYLNIRLTLNKAFDGYGMLRDDVFREGD